jgi:hypothetical protein
MGGEEERRGRNITDTGVETVVYNQIVSRAGSDITIETNAWLQLVHFITSTSLRYASHRWL